jgi:chemotaxis methyl-accepting protein methylase
LPANVKLQDGNVLEPFPKEYLGTYDLVHVKLLYAALKKDESLLAVKNLKTLLKPNGYLFWSEIEAYGYASNPYSAALYEWKSIESAEAVKFGRDPM